MVALTPVCSPAVGQAAAPEPPAARKVPPPDLSDMKKVKKFQQQLAAMSVDEVARYLADRQRPEFGWALRALGNKGTAAIPQLVKLMGRKDMSWSALEYVIRTLLNHGDKGLTVLIELLKSDSPIAQRNAAWGLVKRNKPCKGAIAPLIAILKGKDEPAALCAVNALTLNGSAAADAVPHLIPLMFKTAHHTAGPGLAIEATGLDPKFIPTVIAHLTVKESDRDAQRIQLYVGARLLAIAGKDGTAAPELAAALGHKNPTVRQAAAQAIQTIGKPTRTDAVVKALNAAIAHDATRIDAAAGLVAIGASAKAAVPGLIKDLESGRVESMANLDYSYTCRAAEVLAFIPEALPALIEGLDSDKRVVSVGCSLTIRTDEVTVKRASLKLKEQLARSASPRESKLIAQKIRRIEMPLTTRNGMGRWRWSKRMRAMAAAVKAAAKTEAKTKAE